MYYIYLGMLGPGIAFKNNIILIIYIYIESISVDSVSVLAIISLLLDHILIKIINTIVYNYII